MPSNESKLNLNLKANEDLSHYSQTPKVTAHKLTSNRIMLLGLFVTATISVLSFAGLAVFIHLKKSELAAKANQNSTFKSPEVAGIKNDNSQSAYLETKLPIETSLKNEVVKIDPELSSKNEIKPIEISKSLANNEILKKTTKPVEPIPTFKLKNLTSQDFHDILLNITFENTLDPKIETTITGDVAADRHIYDIAESRGYRFWPQADESKLVEVQPGVRLQEKAKASFIQMSDTAKNDGVILKITSGYRSQSQQNTIFRPRFEALEMAELGGYYDPVDLAKGEADNLIYRALALTAPAGYSRHHTGYAIDLADLSPDNTTSVFNGSKAFIWLSKDNYANARKFGFIPSYPVGLQNVGPEPESWEFVWVGERAL